MKEYFVIAILLISAAVLCVPPVSAAQSVMPVSFDVSVDFQNTTDFIMYLPQGFERHFSWGLNQTHSDVTFNHTMYQKFEESSWCPHANEQAQQYQNISLGLTNMLSICGGVVGTLNKSEDYIKQISSSKESELEYERLWTVCKTQKELSDNETARLQEKQKECDRTNEELDTCESDLNAAEQRASELSQCKQDLDDAKKSKNNTMIVAFIVGIAAGYFMWGRKKKTGPSEQTEVDQMGDGVDFIQ